MWLRRWKNQLLWALFGRNTFLPAPESALSYVVGNRRMVWDEKTHGWRMEIYLHTPEPEESLDE